MLYTSRKNDGKDDDEVLFHSLEPVVKGLGMSLLELSVFRRKKRGGDAGSVQIRAVVYKGESGVTGVDDCSRAHLGILPRLELAFPGADLYVEVSSPGIDRLIKDGREFAHYVGKGVKCYRTDISDWTEGVLCSAGEEKIVLRAKDGELVLPYEVIAKARLSGEI